MNYTIKNELLSVGVSSKGGEFQSIKDASGREYLWQGDEATWPDRGPNLSLYRKNDRGNLHIRRGKIPYGYSWISAVYRNDACEPGRKPSCSGTEEL